MVTVNFSIPELANVPKDSPTLYVWMDYFFADVVSLLNQPVPELRGTYMVPLWPVPGSRSLTQNSSSPDRIDLSDFGQFAVTLDDADMGLAFAGVVILLLEKHDTNDNAIQEMQLAVDIALFTNINAYLKDNWPKPVIGIGPTSDQLNAIFKAVRDAAVSAIKQYSPLWEWFNPDSNVGTSYLYFWAQKGTGGTIPNISGDNDHPQYNQCSFPLSSVIVAETSGVDPCAAQAAALRDQLTSIKNLSNHLHVLQRELANAHPQKHGQIRAAIGEAQTQRMQAQAGLSPVLNNLYLCRLANR